VKYEISPEDLKRFYSKIKFNEETWCWDWVGTTLQRGYGHFKLKRKIWRSHRLSYLIHKGDLIEGLTLNHLCRNRKCCNPDHLEQITSKENILCGESFSAVNKRKTHCKRGHEFTEENTINLSRNRRECRKCRKLHDHNKYYKDLEKSREKSRLNKRKWLSNPENRERRNAKRRKNL